MRVPINAPTVRPLNPNEQKVYSLLRMGYTPKEVARQLHMPYGDEFFCNVHDVTCDTVRHLITSIREKGWEISENEEEEEDVKYTDKQKEKALQLFDEGVTPKEISIKMKLPYKSVWKWCDTYKKQKQFEQNIEEGSNAELADDFDPCEMMLTETPPVVVNADTNIDALEKAWAEYEAKKSLHRRQPVQTQSQNPLGKNLPILYPKIFRLSSAGIFLTIPVRRLRISFICCMRRLTRFQTVCGENTRLLRKSMLL